jgi:ABC-2 type transport system permease protein
VTSRGFLFGAIGTPLILLAIWAFGGGFTAGTPDEEPFQDLEEAASEEQVIGYVDRAGLIEEIPDPVPDGRFVSYETVEAAETGLEQRDIKAYYVVTEDYPETGEIERVSPRFPTAPPDAQTFDWVLVNNLFPEADQERIRQLRYPFGGTGPGFVSTVTPEEDGGDGGMSMMPFVVTIAVMLPLFTGGGYLFQSLAQEKSSRVMEILLVSLRPRQLLTGKLLGLAALIIVQYAIWVAIAGAALVVTGQGAGQLLAGIQLSAAEVLLIVPYALGGFGLYAALMAGIGALTEDMEGSRGWIFVLTLPMMIPIYLWTAIANAPTGPLALILSLFPYSAPVAMLMRMTASAVPPWQLAVSLGLLLIAVVGTIWLMARLFKAQTLLSGESLSLGRFWAALRS